MDAKPEVGQKTGFEEIGARAAPRITAFPPTGLLDSVVGIPSLPITSG